MTPSGRFHWISLVGLLILTAGSLAWLMIGFADSSGVRPVPDGPLSTVEYLTLSSDLSAGEVASMPDSAWRPWNTAGFLPQPVRRTAWVRVTLNNPADIEMRGVLMDTLAFGDRVDLFIREASRPEAWRRLQSGEWCPMAEKALWGRESAFPVTVPARSQTVVYLHYRDYYAVWLQLEWWPHETAFHTSQLRGAIAEGCYFGVLIALLFYNAVLWVRLRFPDTGYYLLYLANFSIYMLLTRRGFSLFGITLGSPWMEAVSVVVLALSAAALAEFTRVLLELAKWTPLADRITKVVRTAMILMAAAAPFFPSALGYVVLFTAVAHLFLLGVAVTAWRAGARQARYFILAFGFLFAGVLPAMAVWLEVLPIKSVIPLVTVGSAFELLLLSVATTERFAQMQRDKLLAQQKLLVEAEQRQTLQEAYADELALEVRERTRELEQASADKDRMITVLGHDLRSPLAGLIHTAERVAGQHDLSAAQRFATDAVQTGRQMLLLIEDLVLWARLRNGMDQARTFDLQSVIGPSVALHRAVAEGTGLELRVSIPEGLLVEVDLVLAQTLVRNLLANALRFARSHIVLAASPCGNRVRIAVRDDGPGLPEAVAARFAAGDYTSGSHQSGLGLRLCLEITNAIGSRLQVDSAPGKGTEFSFTLPSPKTNTEG